MPAELALAHLDDGTRLGTPNPAGVELALTGNLLAGGLELLGGLAGEEDDGDGLVIVLAGAGLPLDGVALAGGDDLAALGLVHGVEPSELGDGARGEGHEGRGGDGELHLDGVGMNDCRQAMNCLSWNDRQGVALSRRE